MDQKIRNFRAQLSRLTVLATHLKGAEGSIYTAFYHDFVDIIDRVQNILGSELSFLYTKISYNTFVNARVMQARVSQAAAYLTERYSEELGLAQTTLVTESLRDKQLRDRCVDLLIAEDNFDRAVSEATRVLEDRIRNNPNSLDSFPGRSW